MMMGQKRVKKLVEKMDHTFLMIIICFYKINNRKEKKKNRVNNSENQKNLLEEGFL